jgi:translation initiation factor 1
MFNCNGTIVNDKTKGKGKIIQLQGDQRTDISKFLIEEGIGTKDTVKIHGH